MYAGISTIYLQGCYIESTLSAHWGETIVFPLALMIAVQWLAVLSPRDYLPIPLFSNHSLVRWFAGLGARARRQTPLLWSVWSLYELNPNHLRPRLCLASSLPPTHHRPHPAALLPSWLPPPPASAGPASLLPVTRTAGGRRPSLYGPWVASASSMGSQRPRLLTRPSLHGRG